MIVYDDMEKAILVGIRLPSSAARAVATSLEELARLAETAGAVCVDTVVQNRPQMDPACAIGRGKAEELRDRCAAEDIQAVIFDDELKPVQQQNLEDIIGVKIIDRPRLILDIFAARARTREGILQVELAQLEYSLPRLSKRGVMLDSQAGGIGTRRGPGERKLELDSRRVRDRITALSRQIELIRKQRGVARAQRVESGIPAVAIVGYTNAGKSTLLNKLCGRSAVYADDKLFATLDPTTRTVTLPDGRRVLFTDTVGFISKLPHALVAAFRATLEEVTTAQCLLHVIDISHPDHERQAAAVYTVLKELGAENIPLITVYNKADLVAQPRLRALKRTGNVIISARTGDNMDALLTLAQDIVSPKLQPHRLVVPYDRAGQVAAIRRLAVVKTETYRQGGIALTIESSREHWAQIQGMLR